MASASRIGTLSFCGVSFIYILCDLAGSPLKEDEIQEAAFSTRASFIRFALQLERCFTIQSRRAFSKPMSLPAFSLSIHLCFKISSRSARNSLYSTEFFTNCDCDFSSDREGISRLFSINFRRGQSKQAIRVFLGPTKHHPYLFNS